MKAIYAFIRHIIFPSSAQICSSIGNSVIKIPTQKLVRSLNFYKKVITIVELISTQP